MPCFTCRSLLATCSRACASAPVSTSRLRTANARSQYGLLDERQLVHHDLRQLRVGEVDGAPREQDVAPIGVDRPAADERLHVGGRQRRRKLRVEPRELVAASRAATS